ncbi:MAG: sulfatase-like hydrolase/transferase [Pirellulaceae bacterium]|nr:sulfatase-like hydrolase/transferase [Planctomycetales bacterium]
MMKLQRTFLAAALYVTVAIVGSPRISQGNELNEVRRQPNVVVILTDDQGWGDLSSSGNKNLQTPNIDSLARDGASFDRFFVCPLCSPTRAEFLTGRYHPRSNVVGVSTGGERMDLDEVTIADLLRNAGYATAAFGKWHNGTQYPYHPNGRGFDEFYGFCSGHWGHYFSPLLDRNGRIVNGHGYTSDDFTEHAMAFIELHRDRPFFVYLPLNTPHSPMQVPERWWSEFADKPLPMRHREPNREDTQHTRAALAMCENTDWNVGRLLAKLGELQLTRDTIVIFFCDNGPNGFRWNGGMKGRKGSTDEGGVRSPLFVSWPGKIAAGQRIMPIAAAIDLLPTIVELTGSSGEGTKPLDGRSLVPLLMATDDSARSAWPERNLFSFWGGKLSVRSQRYRLDHEGHLYDMQVDPGQEKDIVASEPDVASRLADAAQHWRADVLSELKKDDRPFLVGHSDVTWTQLPARDAVATGTIKRSSVHPNCSYFTNWTSANDAVTWDVEVLQEGTYDIDLYYACPPKDVGATVRVSFRNSHVEGRLVEAHDPPVVGAAEDRVPRTESYVKDFKPWRIGQLHLSAGRGQLMVSAVQIPGAQALELRLMTLTRHD